eukprot:TRINITY_DN17497_c0_g1_i1.p2 TRINITY_DN17497_c0_g1~~TRINITY_DN17497_c0_g1_i1.p2  ORF type:complete len:166 (+),score=50.26 TRINITY_DN17497_c0_g1_i1:1408-1905(+)
MDVKPILKKPSFAVTDKKDGADHEQGQKRKMKWDEKNLKDNADYMEANPKMKIDEPDTPFVDYRIEDDEELAEDEKREIEQEGDEQDPEQRMNARLVILETKLQSVATQNDGESTPPRKTSQEEHDAEFKLKRKAVYADEGVKFRDLLKRGMADEDEDEDEEDAE